MMMAIIMIIILQRQEMVEHRPCDCDGHADDGLGHFLKVIMIAIVILVPGVNLTRSSPQEFHNPDCTTLGMMIKLVTIP